MTENFRLLIYQMKNNHLEGSLRAELFKFATIPLRKEENDSNQS